MGVLVVQDKVIDELADAVTLLVAEAREEGRREVLREIANHDEWENEDAGWSDDWCAFCHRERTVGHLSACLWLRAQAVKAS